MKGGPLDINDICEGAERLEQLALWVGAEGWRF